MLVTLRCLGSRSEGVTRATTAIATRAFNTSAPRSGAKLDFAGMYPPIPTSFKPDESVDYDALKKNMDAWNKFGLRGYIVQGSNGEYKVMNVEERVEVIRAAKAACAKDKLIVAGCGMDGTKQTIELGRRMADAGADALLVITPKAPRRAEDALEDHFKAVADSVPVPVLLYNMPRLSGVDMSAAQVVKFAKHPNIVGFKDSGGNIEKFAMIRDLMGPDFQDFALLAGSAGFLLPAMSVGAVGGVCALANVAPAPLLEIMQLFRSGKLEEAAALQSKMAAPNVAVTSKYGVAGLKHALDKIGLAGGRVRAPQMELTANEKADVEAILKRAGIESI